MSATAEDFIKRVAEVADAVAWQAGVGAMEIAGQIISVLHVNPEHIDRFMEEGTALFLDGTLLAENGSLSYMALGGKVHSPSELRERRGRAQ
jgi:hypothetical protein